MVKDNLKTGIGSIAMHVMFWIFGMLECEDVKSLSYVIDEGVIMLTLMCICVVFFQASGMYRSRMGIRNGLLFLMMALSMGICNGIATHDVAEYLLYWGIGITGTVFIWEWKGKRLVEENAGNVMIKSIPFVPTGGVWGARMLYASVGPKKAERLFMGLFILLEVLLASIGTFGIIIDAHKNARKRPVGKCVKSRTPNRRRCMAGSICMILSVYFVYHLYCLYATEDIMDDIDKASKGEIEVESGSPYAGFQGDENDCTYDIVRYFTYCGLKEGKIYITCKDRYVFDDGEVSESSDWFYIEIEKADGKWRAVRCVGEP